MTHPHLQTPHAAPPDRYAVSTDGEPESFFEVFDTYNEALAHGHQTYANEDRFFIHRIRRMRPSINYGDSMFSELFNHLEDDEAHWEDDELFREDKWREPIRELEQALDSVVQAWFDKHDAWAEFRCYETLETTTVENDQVHRTPKTGVG